MDSRGWMPIASAREGQVVWTKIHCEGGARNVQRLRRQGNLWFVPDGSMYVYYRPTHWAPDSALPPPPSPEA